jgi:hypothetical protein
MHIFGGKHRFRAITCTHLSSIGNRNPMPTTPVVVLLLNVMTSFARFSATDIAVASSGGAPTASAMLLDV